MHINVTSLTEIVLHAHGVTNCTRVCNHYHQYTDYRHHIIRVAMSFRPEQEYVPLILALSTLAFSYMYAASCFTWSRFLNMTHRVYTNLVSLSNFSTSWTRFNSGTGVHIALPHENLVFRQGFSDL